MTNLDIDAADIHGLVVSVLNKAGYRPFGHDGSAWEHPNGTKITTGYTGGQIRVRRFIPGNDRFTRIPPIVWDIREVPDEDQVAEFIGERSPAPALTAEEFAVIEAFEAAAEAPESFRERLIEAMHLELDALGLAPIQSSAPEFLADAALAVIRGDR